MQELHRLQAEHRSLVEQHDALERQFEETLRDERAARYRHKSLMSWIRTGTLAQITLFFIGIATGQWIVMWLRG